jgi:hypothetical protein
MGGQPYPLDAVADDAELAQLLDQRPGELGPFPVVVDDRQHLVVDEVPGAPPVVALLGRSSEVSWSPIRK